MTNYQIAYCEANRELVFREAVKRYGIEVYCPVSRIQIRPRHKRRNRIIERAIFPHYVFTAQSHNLNDVVRVLPGFLSWLRAEEDEIIMVNDNVINELKNRESSGEFDRISKNPSTVFCQGTVVKVLVGPLAGFTGTIKRAPKRQLVAKVEINGKIFDIPLVLLAIVI